jgi:protein-S-isoprenylcysteine O-methyltransferase Ste14
MHKFIVTVLFLLFSVAQSPAQQVTDAGAMETNGKIYVVMAVCLTVLAGLLFYLISLDRKISNIEKKKD